MNPKKSLPSWEGHPAYVIGGGPSLEGFNFDLLKGRRTIGCNHAFRLGADICQICFFGDSGFFYGNAELLEKFEGHVVTSQGGIPRDLPWIHYFRRTNHGIPTASNHLAWNSNSGAAAAHLAILLGAKIVYMLGIDCLHAQPKPQKKNNWHEHGPEPRSAYVLRRHISGFQTFSHWLPRIHPDRSLIFLSDQKLLPGFQRESLTEHFSPVSEAPEGEEWAAPLS